MVLRTMLFGLATMLTSVLCMYEDEATMSNPGFMRRCGFNFCSKTCMQTWSYAVRLDDEQRKSTYAADLFCCHTKVPCVTTANISDVATEDGSALATMNSSIVTDSCRRRYLFCCHRDISSVQPEDIA